MKVLLRVVVVPIVLVAVACGGQGSAASRSSSDVPPRQAPTSSVRQRQAATTAAPSGTDRQTVPPTTTSTAARPPIPGSTVSSVVPTAVVSTSPPPAVGPPTVTPPRGPTDPWLVAVRTEGEVELWAAAGKVHSFRACAPAVLGGCLVDVAVSDSAVWLVRNDGGGHPDLLRASCLDGHVQTLSLGDLLPGATDVRSIAVSADDGTLWFAAATNGDPGGLGKLYVRDAAGTRALHSDVAVIDVALSRDGRRLAYSGYRNTGDGSYPSHAVLVVREVATGVERMLALEAQAETPVAPYSLAWSRDGRHLAFDLGWEGGVPEVVDVDAAATLDDALPLPGIEPEWQSVPMCWTGVDNLAVGRWRSGIDGPYVPGDLDDLDLAAGSYRPRGVHLFSFGMVCRDDGAVAVRPDVGSNDAGPLPTDLVVIRSDGSTAVLGRGYTQILGP